MLGEPGQRSSDGCLDARTGSECRCYDCRRDMRWCKTRRSTCFAVCGMGGILRRAWSRESHHSLCPGQDRFGRRCHEEQFSVFGYNPQRDPENLHSGSLREDAHHSRFTWRGRWVAWRGAGVVVEKSVGRPEHRLMRLPKWLLLSIAVPVLWGLWGALTEIPEKWLKPSFPPTLGYIVWSLTMIPVSVFALRVIKWKMTMSRQSIFYGCAVGFSGGAGQLLLFWVLQQG